MAMNDYAAVKAGVNGVMDDAPGPSDAPEAGETVEMPQTQEAGAGENTGISQAGYSGGGQQFSGYEDDASNKLHEIAEAIVNEKWQELLSSVGNIAVWKEKVDTNILSIKQEIVRINERFDNLQNAVLGKIKDYDVDMKNVSTEMKALEKVFEKIIEPLTNNVKELNRITKEMKEMR